MTISDKLADLGNKHFAEFRKRQHDRVLYEEEWLCLLRQSRGEYDPETLQKFESSPVEKTGSRVYPQWTRSKEVPLYAKLVRFILSEKERNFGLKPTSKPTVDSENLTNIVQGLITQDEQGNPVFPTDEQIEREIMSFVKDRTVKMETTIADQLEEDKYKDTQKKVIKSAIRYGLGITKGPEVQSYTENELVYQEGETVTKMLDYLKAFFSGVKPVSGKWIQKEVTKYRPTGKFLPIWNFYPDINTVDLASNYEIYEYSSMFKHELRKLGDRKGYFRDAIEKVIEDKPDGDYILQQWELLLLENDKNKQDVRKNNKYGIIERNGFIDSKILFEAGIIEEDDGREHFCNEVLVGNEIIRLVVWPENVIAGLTDLYHIFYYDKDETSIFGQGLVKTIRSSALAVAALARNALNNAAWSAGPLGEVNAELLHPSQRAAAGQLHPLKLFVRVGTGQDANQKVLHFYDVPSRSAEFINLINAFKELGDLESSLPSYLFGSPSPNETAEAASNRYASMIDFIQNLVKNYDDANVSFINSVFKWNQEFNPDPSIKGDMQVVAIGTAAQLIKEMTSQQMTLYMQALPDQGKKVIDWRKYAKQTLRPMLDNPEDVLLSEEVIKANEEREAAMQEELAQLNKRAMEVKANYDEGKDLNMRAKAKLTEATIPQKAESLAIKNEQEMAAIEQQTVDLAHSLKELVAGKPEVKNSVPQ